MTTFYLGCAVIGGVVLVCQFLLTLLGIGGDHDVGIGDHHFDVGGGDSHDAGWFFGILSFRSLVAAVAFFGLGGMAASSGGLSAYLAFLAAAFTGAAMMLIVAWLMRTLHSLRSEGNVRIERAVGAMGTVYLTVPPAGEGVGKVTVSVQNRTMEYQAVTAKKSSLATGTSVVVVGVAGPNMIEVDTLPE